MAQYIEAFGQTLEFPDGMSEADMAKALKKNALQLSPAYQRGRDMNNSVGGAALQGLASVAQGPTFGFADEIGGAVGGVASMLKGDGFGAGYRDTRDMLRGAADKQAEENPVTTALTRGAASLPLAVRAPQAIGAGIQRMAPQATAAFRASPNGAAFVSNLQRNHPLLSGLAAASGFGVASGAVEGLGSSKADSPEGMGGDALKSAAIGAAAPLLLVPALRGAGAVAENVVARFSDSQALRMAKEKVAEAFLRDTRGNAITNPIPQATARLGKLGPEASVADSGGTSVRALLDTLATLPGQTKDATERLIHSRQASRADRLIGAADDALGSQGQRLRSTVSRLIEEREQAAGPLYTNLRKITVPAAPELDALIDAARELGATKLGREIAGAKMRPYSLDQAAPSAGMNSTLMNSRPGQQGYSMSDLDFLKQALDTIYTKRGINAATGEANPMGNAIWELRTKLVQRLDADTNGAYAAARSAFAGPSAIIDAANIGRKAMTQDGDAIRGLTERMGASELDGFRVGAFEALRAKLGREAGQTEIIKMWKEPATREKLLAMFPDERAFRQFASRVAAEGRLKSLESVGRGSQTAARQYGAGDLDAPAIRQFGAAAVDAKTGNFPGLMDKAASSWNRVATPEPVRDAMGRILLSRGGDAEAGLLSVQQIAEEVATNRRRQAGALGLLGGLF